MMSTKADVKFIGNDTSRPLLPDTTTTITYVDNFSMKDIGAGKRLAKPIKSRGERTSPHAAKIIIDAASDVPQDVVDCAKLAAGIWENIIDADIVFKIKIKYGSINGDISTSVVYYYKNDICYPAAFKNIGSENIDIDVLTSAGNITVNQTIDWNYGVGGNVEEHKKNLTYGLMRSIGRVMGFGSSILLNKGTYRFSNIDNYTVFDRLIKSREDMIPLSEVPFKRRQSSSELTEYMNLNEHVVSDGKESYNLAPAPYSESNPPLTALEDGLMKPIIYPGEYCIQVDDDVWNILKMIGWKLKSEDALDIVCPDAINGIVDGAQDHVFSLSRKVNAITSPEWKLTCEMENGETDVMDLKDNGLCCTVPEMFSVASSYKKDINGFIRGRLEFSGLFNGIRVKARPYNVYFDVGPGIKSVAIDSIGYSEDRNFFKAYYTARFRGADLLEVLPKEEFSSVVVRNVVREPVMVRSSTPWLFTGGHVWLQFRVRTESGEDTRTILFQPFTQEWSDITKTPAAADVQSPTLPGIEDIGYTVDVYSVDGTSVIRGCSDTEPDLSTLGQGVYIITRRYENGYIQSSKIIIK